MVKFDIGLLLQSHLFLLVTELCLSKTTRKRNLPMTGQMNQKANFILVQGFLFISLVLEIRQILRRFPKLMIDICILIAILKYINFNHLEEK